MSLVIPGARRETIVAGEICAVQVPLGAGWQKSAVISLLSFVWKTWRTVASTQAVALEPSAKARHQKLIYVELRRSTR